MRGGCFESMINLREQRFGNLIVLEKTSGRDTRGSILWKCRCDCGNITTVSSNKLRSGHTRSCGCLRRISPQNRRIKNKYELHENYGIGYTSNTQIAFYFDLEDYEIIKDYTWFESDQGYIISCINGKLRRMHRLVFQCKENELIDHRNCKKFDNRKENLRLANKQLNGINRGAGKNNLLGVKGVSYDKRANVYIARIMIDGKSIQIGSSKSLEDARIMREIAEVELFGEFAYKGGGLFD